MMTNGKATEKLLKSISQRLSSREDCKDASYTVTIDALGVHMYPIIYVYPNCHKRKPSDRIDVLSFILQAKFSDIMLSEAQDQLVTGTYIYDTMDRGKKRRWRRIDEA